MFLKTPTCFLITGQPTNAPIRGTVDQACADNGVELLSVETASLRSSITGDVAEAIERADFVIADLTGFPTNAVFELGVAYGIRKSIFAMSQEGDDRPTDIAGLRILYYNPDDQEKLRHYLSDWVSETVAASNSRR